MKILHSALIKDIKSASGILNQMYDEKLASKSLEDSVEVKVFTCNKIDNKYEDLLVFSKKRFKGKINKWFSLRVEYYNWLISQENLFDCFILRHTPYDPLQAYFIRRASKPVFLVHHTKELDELKLIKNKGYILYLLEIFFGKMSIKKAKGIIGVTNEIVKYEIDRVKDHNKLSILYPNGIRYSSEIFLNKFEDKINLIFIASYFFDWHGLDLLLDSIEENKDKEFVLHLVGDLSDAQLSRIKLDNRIKAYGKLNRDEIKKLVFKSSLGLGSFALYRKNLNEACTLKVREYLYYGLPVYSGHIDIFPKDFKYYKYGACDINKILDFANEIKGEKAEKVSIASKPYIDKVKLLNNLVDTIKGIVDVK